MPSKQQLESKYLSVQRLMEGPRRGPTPGPQTSQPHASTQSQLVFKNHLYGRTGPEFQTLFAYQPNHRGVMGGSSRFKQFSAWHANEGR
ncbi:hypothetical protein CDAR_486201 [Caerostris darwini]|uniref:Uncharacterized protein n=1 Tax=Caerostris darwini TaxID=1538125 RepID=A0AAV4M9X0_9ARAC|nr:hypothetical protein CDAR_486201 [Caerostris darwini]